MFINIQHSTFNIQRPREHPTSKIERPRMIHGGWMFDVGCSMLTRSFMDPVRVKTDVVAFHIPSIARVRLGERPREPLFHWFTHSCSLGRTPHLDGCAHRGGRLSMSFPRVTSFITSQADR